MAQYAYTVAWSRPGGRRLPSHAVDEGEGTLRIDNVQSSDAGNYTCIGSNYYRIATDEAVLEIECKLHFVIVLI